MEDLDSDIMTVKLRLQDAVAYTKLIRKAKAVKKINAIKSAESSDADDYDNIKICDQELSQMFGKGDFSMLEVIGQFNKGFIICKLGIRDLFILD